MGAREFSKSLSQPFQLSLRIRHPNMDPAEISRELQLEAEHSFRAGASRQSKSVRPSASTSVYAESYWLGTLNPFAWTGDTPSFDISEGARRESMDDLMTRSLDAALGLCMLRFSRQHLNFIRRIQAEGGQVRILVELSAHAVPGFTLTAHLGRMLHELGIVIDFEFVSN